MKWKQAALLPDQSHKTILLLRFDTMKKQKYYTVWKGHRPGVYASWKDCEAQVKGFNGARYRSFDTMEEAKLAFRSDPELYRKPPGTEERIDYRKFIGSGIIGNSIAVDAACSGNPGAIEYRGVFTETGSELFRQGPFPLGTNNIGEFLAIVHALAWMQKNKLELPVYTDSANAILWVKQKTAKTKMVQNDKNKKLFELITRAVSWLNNNEYKNPILKWNTEEWGEIPADFGRK